MFAVFQLIFNEYLQFWQYNVSTNVIAHLFRSDWRQLDLTECQFTHWCSEITAHVESTRHIVRLNTPGEILTRYKKISAVHGEPVGVWVENLSLSPRDTEAMECVEARSATLCEVEGKLAVVVFLGHSDQQESASHPLPLLPRTVRVEQLGEGKMRGGGREQKEVRMVSKFCKSPVH